MREARARGHAGNQRLHDRWLSFQTRGKRTVVANAAIARELAGWCWSLAVMTLTGPGSFRSPTVVTAASRGDSRHAL